MELNDLLTDLEIQVAAIQKTLVAIKGIEHSHSPLCVDTLFTRKEAAYFIGRSERTLDRLCEEKRIRRIMTKSGIRIRKSELLAFNGLDINELNAPEKGSIIGRLKQ